jgi:hypothetical protein
MLTGLRRAERARGGVCADGGRADARRHGAVARYSGPVRIVVSDDAERDRCGRRASRVRARTVSGNTTITDDGGRFVFAGLPAGRYSVGASKATWVAANYGATRPLRPGSAIPLADGQKLDIVIRMPRGGVITGVVLDHNNQPSAGTPVRRCVRDRQRRAKAGIRRQRLADDRGVYRIFGLAPGDYLVGATGLARPARAPPDERRRRAARHVR